jgi:ABC-2 type transport system ATP-binding protein
MAAAVKADGIEKRFGSVVAVDDLSLEVESGEILGVLGPTGRARRPRSGF